MVQVTRYKRIQVSGSISLQFRVLFGSPCTLCLVPCALIILTCIFDSMTAVIVVFILGYVAIASENFIRINKAATALVTGVLCWTIFAFVSPSPGSVSEELNHHLGELSQILFFLMGAMTIVELIDAHDGFEIITNRIQTLSKKKLIWIIAVLSFFLSAVLDNLTTTIVMVSLIRKLVSDKKTRLMMAGMIVIAANAGGAWSPIGDVTTTMLWIGGQITAGNIILKLFLPSLFCLLLPLLIMSMKSKGDFQRPAEPFGPGAEIPTTEKQRKIIFFSGISILLLVPVFKTVTHLPPYMGMLIGLGIIWIITEFLHGEKDEEDRKNFTVAYALRKIDSPSILFFLGILLAIAALESTGHLLQTAGWIDEHIPNENGKVISIGLLSAVVDNVPLVAASMGMYDMQQYPTDHYFWEFLAYSTGTGGSALIIGSAAGVAAMGLEKIDFFWYIKKISLLALLGFFAGAAVYILQHILFFK
jgi:Na+/H+ antiporter NhaD/arsenite permease-like protein